MKGAKYVSGVGCNASVTILALWPLYRRGLVRETVVEVKVGSSEGGAKAGPASHHPERAGVVRSYAPQGHRHIAYISASRSGGALTLYRTLPGRASEA